MCHKRIRFSTGVRGGFLPGGLSPVRYWAGKPDTTLKASGLPQPHVGFAQLGSAFLTGSLSPSWRA